MLSKRIFPAVRLLVWLFLSCAVLFAQSERGVISGTVKDATGTVVPGAKVVANETQTNYTIPNILVCTYSMRVEKAGFRPAVLSGLTVNAAVRSLFDLASLT